MDNYTCLFCKNLFAPKKSIRKFCSRNCYYESKKDIDLAEKYYTLYKQGFTFKQIGENFNVHPSAVSDLFRKHGIEKRKRHLKEWIEVDGQKYTISKGYYQSTSTGKCLHQYIWEKHYGAIPKDYHIHHVNENTLDNRIENLQCLSRREHLKIHHNKRFPQVPVIQLSTGIIYSSINEAAKAVNRGVPSIYRAVKYGTKSANSYWKKVESP